MESIPNYVLTILFLGGVIFGCQQQKNADDPYKDSREIYGEAIEIHDEVMPKMGEIMELQKTLKSSKETLTDENVINQADSTMNDLENAYDQMMNWMRNIPRIPEFSPGGNPEEVSGEPLPDPKDLKESLIRSLEEIKKVKRHVNESIKNAEKLLESLSVS
jgi:hypothetical protein